MVLSSWPGALIGTWEKANAHIEAGTDCPQRVRTACPPKREGGEGAHGTPYIGHYTPTVTGKEGNEGGKRGVKEYVCL